MSERYYLASRRTGQVMVTWLEADFGGLLPLCPESMVQNTVMFDWGNDGSRSQLLALSLLFDALQDFTRASCLYLRFVDRVIGKIHSDNWNLSRSKIQAWAWKVELEDVADQVNG